MNLSEVFTLLAQSGCRLKLEAAGSIILDVPAGAPPVPRSVLDSLAMHRESLAAVLTAELPEPQGAGLENKHDPAIGSPVANYQDEVEKIYEPTPEELEARKKVREDILRRARAAAAAKEKKKSVANNPASELPGVRMWRNIFEAENRKKG